MSLIDIGDLTIDGALGTKQQRLFNAIQQKITSGLWLKGCKLPSTRSLAMTLNLSRNTVINSYEQLAAEGYIQSKVNSGYFISVTLPEQFYSATPPQKHQRSSDVNVNINTAFAPGVPDLQRFPYSQWQKLIQRHSTRPVLSGNQDIQGLLELRQSLAQYLASSRSVACNADDIIITCGAQQALTLAILATVNSNEHILVEDPGYLRVNHIISCFGLNSAPLIVRPKTGISLDQIESSNARTIYLTPSNQYPMGTTINLEQRLQLLNWAKSRQSWIIEDDYDSEFQFSHRPFTSLQGLSAQISQQQRVIYIGSMSKVMFNGLRLGYMVMPSLLKKDCLAIKDAITGFTSPVSQAALADFICDGSLIRHIRKMRRLYEKKCHLMLNTIEELFGDAVEVISQQAGLHVTLKWKSGISEDAFSQQAIRAGIIIRPLNYYESSASLSRAWQAAVLGFGNVAIEQIVPKIKQLAAIFFEHSYERSNKVLHHDSPQ